MFDLPTYVSARSWGPPEDRTDGVYAESAGPQNQTEMVRVTVGDAVFLTVPGELPPEMELFVLGLGQHELGYIVPGYDVHLIEAPATWPASVRAWCPSAGSRPRPAARATTRRRCRSPPPRQAIHRSHGHSHLPEADVRAPDAAHR